MGGHSERDRQCNQTDFEAGSQVQSSVRFFDEFAYKASVLVDGEGTGDLKQRARSWVALGIHDDIESRNPVSCLFERE